MTQKMRLLDLPKSTQLYLQFIRGQISAADFDEGLEGCIQDDLDIEFETKEPDTLIEQQHKDVASNAGVHQSSKPALEHSEPPARTPALSPAVANRKTKGKKMTSDIPMVLIDPSPYQARGYIDEKGIIELTESIRIDGLINPITVRTQNDRYELLAGERRWRAVKLLEWEKISAITKDVDDYQARRIVLTENLMRENLTEIEEIHANADYVDMLMCKDEEYAKIHKLPIERLAWVLMKIDSDRRNGTDYFTTQLGGKIDDAFKSLPKLLDPLVFYRKVLRSYIKMDEEVKDISVEKKTPKVSSESIAES